MNNLKVNLLNGIDRYFKHLSNFGRINNSNKDNLLITLFISQMLEGPMSYYVNEDDYKILDSLLYCINGQSCLIDYSKYSKNKSIFIYSTHDLNPTKLTEDDFMIRTTGDGEIRFHIL